MKSHPDNPLIKCLTEDAHPLAEAGAAEARYRHHRRKTTVRLASGALLLLLALTIVFQQSERPAKLSPLVTTSQPANFPAYVKAYTNPEMARIEAIPNDASEREKQLLKEFADIPVLIVRNERGHVTSVKVFER